MKETESQKIAVVIGATGLVGSELINQLISSKEIKTIITLSRRPLKQSADKLQNHVIDFDDLGQYKDLIKGDLFFSCLGTTRKQAGSTAAQIKVDFEYQLKAAQIASENGIPHYLLVSSSGANANSSFAYMKMKGALEEQVKTLPFKRVSIFQPSLLLGNRTKARVGEFMAGMVMPTLCKIPGLHSYRPISGKQVASKMTEVALREGAALEYFVLNDVFPEKDDNLRR
ncbi:NAD-dependent epimerase/dehydratase family protein [Endozoicomonas lisbonensis]|uniref:Uncharacterized protein YbjT (DUF2867 family) n=1 Tax=Endozoicomonas lisbonensis TaxID=3120522 RepID=A0ABV2SJA9_9GAMM